MAEKSIQQASVFRNIILHTPVNFWFCSCDLLKPKYVCYQAMKKLIVKKTPIVVKEMKQKCKKKMFLFIFIDKQNMNFMKL